ncbi:uncharacterized protein LOC127880695 [Dreissena polymorpha]|nr:uncharacterized protein LOC127880695 [Dreissena polymorpha]XP_052283990.1 uncharacterized protein LOC127880695 [Dreissena polymorpha]
MVGYHHREIVLVIRTFIGKFIKTSVLNSLSDVTKVDFSCREIQRDDDLLAVCVAARTYLAENEDVHPELGASFFRNVRDFHEEMTSKVISKFPLTDAILQSSTPRL